MTERFDRRFVSAPALLLVVAVLVMLMPGGAGMSRAAGEASLQGDVNCDTAVNAVDSLQILRSVAGLGTTAGCLADAGDVNCDTNVNSVDALRILRYVAGLSNTTPDGCVPIGEPLGPLSPQVLAAWLYAAPNDEARYHALLKVMEVLRIGVYTSDGGEVQQGAERGPGDFYLYDFELRMMAASLGRGDNSWGVQQIADTLDQVGFREDGQPFTGDNLNQILREATNDSLATPEEASSLLPLLVRELGLRHETPYDLADDLDVNEAKFDGLQMTLILVGLTLPVIAGEGPLDTLASTLVANSNGILTSRPVVLTDPCSDFRGPVEYVLVPIKYYLTAVKWIGAVAKKTVGFIDIIHGEQLALSVQVKALDSSVGPTHYDHGSESPGQNLKFRIEVRMLDDLGETIVKCGYLATIDYPAKGGIPDVKVLFQHSIEAQLKDHGTLDCTGPFCERTTGADGIATLTFDPKSETPPYGQGLEKDASGGVDGIALYQSKFNNLFGTLAQYLTPKYGSIRWSVLYHESCPLAGGGGSQAPGAAPLAASNPGGSVSIAAIGSLDELPCTWTGTSHGKIHHYIAGYYDEVGEINGTFTFGNPQRSDNPPPSANAVTYEITSGSATWHAAGHVGVCPFSKGGTEEVAGRLAVLDDGSGHLTYGGSASTLGQDRGTGCFGDGIPIIETIWFFDTCPVTDSWPLTGLDLSGSCNNDHPQLWHDEFDWHLTAGSCQPSPEPVCQ